MEDIKQYIKLFKRKNDKFGHWQSFGKIHCMIKSLTITTRTTNSNNNDNDKNNRAASKGDKIKRMIFLV